MRKLVRSKSETDMFFDKQNLEIINENLRKFRDIKMIKNNPIDQNISFTRGNKNIIKKKKISALMNSKI